MFAILCPLKAEFEVACRVLSSKQLLMAVGGHGKVNFAVKATELIVNHPEIETLICLGVAGGLDPALSPLDVVVGTKTVEHDYYERFGSAKSLPQVKGDQQLLEQARSFEFDSKHSLHFGVIASGDEDVVSLERAQQIVDRTSAQAVAWEGIGGAKVCRLLNKKFIEVRGITDMCSTDTPDAFKRHLEPAMINASKVVKHMIHF